MNYSEAVEYLYNATPLFQSKGVGAYKPGLQTTHLLDAHFNHPHMHFKTIHVAGTNGKGSTSHMLASVLQAQGYKVGLYTSPHLVDFRERIRVNGDMIGQQYVCDFIEQKRGFFEPLYPSFFELTTAMAFKYFAEQQIDVAVVEVGLGGRLDCTNIVSPILSVITNISIDHTQLLGVTETEIAREKAGIIKPHVPVVIGEYTPATREVFDAVAKDMDAPIFYAQEMPEVLDFDIQNNGIDFQTVSWGALHCDLMGNYQVRNVNTVLTALKHLPSLHINKASVGRGLANVQRNTGLMGRWQILGQHPLVVCDTGHNSGGWKYLAEHLHTLPDLHVVFGVSNDKAIDEILCLLPSSANYYWTQASVARALNAEELQQKATAIGLSGLAYPDVKSAFDAAYRSSSGNSTIFVGGSSFVVADYLGLVIK